MIVIGSNAKAALFYRIRPILLWDVLGEISIACFGFELEHRIKRTIKMLQYLECRLL